MGTIMPAYELWVCFCLMFGLGMMGVMSVSHSRVAGPPGALSIPPSPLQDAPGGAVEDCKYLHCFAETSLLLLQLTELPQQQARSAGDLTPSQPRTTND